MNQHRTVFQKMGYLGEAGMGGGGKTYVVLSIHGKALAWGTRYFSNSFEREILLSFQGLMVQRNKLQETCFRLP